MRLPPLQTKIPILSDGIALLLSAALAASLVSCATTDPSRNADHIGTGLAEYRQIILNFKKVVDATMKALDPMAASTRGDPRAAFEKFTKAVHRLEVDSVQARARGQAIRIRGEAYFDQWQQQLAAVSDAQVRQRAAERRAEVKQGFERVRQVTQGPRDAIKPFLLSLRELEVVLEGNLTASGVAAAQDLFRSSREKGARLQQGLEAILTELDAVTATLLPSGKHASH
jgi:hypothetical protein